MTHRIRAAVQWPTAAAASGWECSAPAEHEQQRDGAGPAGLVAGADAGAVVAVEVFVERDQVVPVRVGLELLYSAVDRPASVLVVGERRRQARGDFGGDLEQVHLLPRAGGALDFELVAVVAVQLSQPAQDDDVHREPHRAAPVGVAAEHAGVRLGRKIVDVVLLPAPVEDARLVEMAARDRADSVWAEELVLVEHGFEDPPQPQLVDERQDPPALRVGTGQVRQRRQRVGEVANELLGALQQHRVALQQLTVEHGRGAHRQKPDERARFELDRGAVGHPHHVVVEAIVIVPVARCRHPAGSSRSRSTRNGSRT